jgi:hypothetical protein
MEDIYIKTQRQLLILPEKDLMMCLTLRPDLYQSAISRGKGYKRAQTAAKRNAEGFDRWQLYEALKVCRSIDKDTLSWISGMDTREMREGLIEYLTAISR